MGDLDSDHRDEGWVAVTCKNHPNLRWTMKDPRTAHLRISSNPQLMFDGDTERPDAHVWSHGEVSPEARREMEEKGWVFECPCPYSDLVPIFPDED